MTREKDHQPYTQAGTDTEAAEISAAYSRSAAELYEKAENFDFAERVLAKVLENVESGSEHPLTEEDLISLIAQAASLDLVVETVTAAKDQVAEAAASHNRMAHDSSEMSSFSLKA